MAIFEKHEKHDKIAAEWLLDYPSLWLSTAPGAINMVRPNSTKWRALIYDIKDNLPEHLAEFLDYRQRARSDRRWVGPVAGLYVAAGQRAPSRQTMWRWWREIVEATARFAAEEGLV